MILRRCPTRLPLENLLAITYSFRFARRQFLLELPEELQLLWDGKVALLSLDIVAPDRQARLPLHVHARRGPLRALGLRSSEVVADDKSVRAAETASTSLSRRTHCATASCAGMLGGR